MLLSPEDGKALISFMILLTASFDFSIYLDIDPVVSMQKTISIIFELPVL